MKKEYTMILNQRKAILVNDETSIRNLDSNTGIYLTAAKVAHYRLVADNKRKRKRQERKQQIRQSPETCIFNKSDAKIIINTKTL